MSNSILEQLEACPADDVSLLLWDLYHAMHMREPQWRNASQHIYYVAYEADVLLNSDGFEKLIEQHTSLEDYADALGRVGLPQALPIFERAISMLPPELRDRANEAALFNHTRTIFEPLNELLGDYYAATANGCATMRSFILERRSDFSEFSRVERQN